MCFLYTLKQYLPLQMDTGTCLFLALTIRIILRVGSVLVEITHQANYMSRMANLDMGILILPLVSPLELNTNYKIGIAASSSGSVICVNGNTYTISTSYNPSEMQYDLHVGGSWRQRTDGQRNMRGYVKNLKLYDKTLTSEELIRLTS